MHASKPWLNAFFALDRANMWLDGLESTAIKRSICFFCRLWVTNEKSQQSVIFNIMPKGHTEYNRISRHVVRTQNK